jgi:microcin C transport system substrate-binding protein
LIGAGVHLQPTRSKIPDPAVRAIRLMFNFEWSNETLFYGLYDRVDSFWQNSDLQARQPSVGRAALLQPSLTTAPPSNLDDETVLLPSDACRCPTTAPSGAWRPDLWLVQLDCGR